MTGLAAAFLIAVSLGGPQSASAEQSALARAKELYITAAYDEALAALDAVPRDESAGEPVEVAEYRVFCLLALDRRDDAKRVIQNLVSSHPFYHLPEGQTSPRIQTVFREIRRQIFPDVIQRSYVDAKAAFDRHEPGATEKFDSVITMLDDPDAQGVPALADLRTVAVGFRDLSKAAAAAPPPAPPPPAPANGSSAAPGPAAAQPQTASSGAADPPGDRTEPERPAGTGTATPTTNAIVPPVAIYQPIPPWVTTTSTDQQQEFRGTLELLIDRAGHVASVKLRKSITPRYDAELLRAARTWRFRPATKDGEPTPFVKVVDVQLIPR